MESSISHESNVIRHIVESAEIDVQLKCSDYNLSRVIIYEAKCIKKTRLVKNPYSFCWTHFNL